MAILGLDPTLRLQSSITSDPRVDKPAVGGATPRISAVRQGVLGAVAALAVAVVLANVVDMQRGRATALVLAVAAWLVLSHLALPAYERATSFVPVLRFSAVLGAGAIVTVIAGVSQEAPVHRAAIVLAGVGVTAGLSTVAHRIALRRIPTVLVGPDADVRRLALRWSDRRDVRVVDTYGWSSSMDLGEYRSDIVSAVLASVIRHRASSVVVAAGPALSSPALRHLAWTLQRAQVECLVVADMNGHVESLQPRRVGDQVALALRVPGDHLASRLTKSAMDRLGAAVGLALLSPLLLAIMVAIRIDSPGPATFRQVRTGRDGRPFTMYKFRSMVPGAESRLGDLLDLNEGAGPLFKMTDDPRITRLGHFLRRTSLDELLQLVNVVKGDMSLVGPRPALPSETSSYDPWTWRRLHVRPGLTGLWQVSGRSALTWEEAVRMDLEYVNHQSLRLDLSILARTVGAVARRDGAH